MTNLSRIHKNSVANVTRDAARRLVKSGRKPLPLELRRVNRVVVRFNAVEFEAIQRLFKDRECAEVVRELALEAARSKTAGRTNE